MCKGEREGDGDGIFARLGLGGKSLGDKLTFLQHSFGCVITINKQATACNLSTLLFLLIKSITGRW